MIPRGRLVAGAAVLIACGQYFVAEGLAAWAWTTPYSYSRNYISDLGVTSCVLGGPCSPWGLVMNAGLVLSGVLAATAAVLLGALVPGALPRRLLIGFVLAHAIGSALVGFVPSAPGMHAGTPLLHLIGAYLAIGGGNLSLIVAGIGLSQTWVTTAFRRFSILMGLCGLVSAVLLLLTRRWPPGLLERGAVDTITLWEITAGILLAAVVSGRERARQPPAAVRLRNLG